MRHGEVVCFDSNTARNMVSMGVTRRGKTHILQWTRFLHTQFAVDVFSFDFDAKTLVIQSITSTFVHQNPQRLLKRAIKDEVNSGWVQISSSSEPGSGDGL